MMKASTLHLIDRLQFHWLTASIINVALSKIKYFFSGSAGQALLVHQLNCAQV